MERLNPENLRSELIQLTEKQISILEKRAFDVVTEVELSEYEERRKRIRDLLIVLRQLDLPA
jgi:hypothetical protein